MDWNVFDAVIIRSTWDYQQAPDRFIATLEAIETSSARLFNPLSICKWNLNKTYLRELEQSGVPIIPSEWPARLDRAGLDSLFHRLGCPKIVIKPVVGANADDTFVVQAGDPTNRELALQTFCSSPSVAQPFVDSICERGETSLFFFGGEYSHAVLKTPKTGDFRVQEEHGGQIQPIEPAAEIQQVAKQALASIPECLLYARIDVVTLADGSPAIIEVELIEPSLYFEFDSESPVRFAQALERMHSV